MLTRRSFFAAMVAPLAALPILRSLLRSKNAQTVRKGVIYARPFNDHHVIIRATQTLEGGSLVVWDATERPETRRGAFPSEIPLVRAAKTGRDFDEHLLVGRAAVTCAFVEAKNYAVAQTKGWAYIRVEGRS